MRHPIMEAPTLAGTRLDLVPLGPEHASELFRVLDADMFAILAGRPTAWTEPAFAEFVHRCCTAPGRMPFAIRLRGDGRVVGSTSLFDFRPEHRGVEIGFTWIARGWQGSFVNPESKLLLLRHAFGTLRMLRVQLKTDARNERSQRAMAKLGCVREGVLRKHMVLPDGHVRDTVLFSITDDEWPRVEAGLLARLARFPAPA
jgi:ribosomal-protein-alanine N-acetyltransferase